MSRISANDLKTKGVAAIEAVLAEHAEAIKRALKVEIRTTVVMV